MGKTPGKPAPGRGPSAKKERSSTSRNLSSSAPNPEDLKRFERDSAKYQKGKGKRWVDGLHAQGDSSQSQSSSQHQGGKASGRNSGESTASATSGRTSGESTAAMLDKLSVQGGLEGESCSSSQQVPSIGLTPASSSSQQVPSIGLTPTSPEAGNRQEKAGKGDVSTRTGAPAPTKASSSTEDAGPSKAATASSKQKSVASKHEMSGKGKGKSKKIDRSGSGKQTAGKQKGRRDQTSQPSQKRQCRSEEELNQQEPENVAKTSSSAGTKKETTLEKNQLAIQKFKKAEPYQSWRKFVPEGERPNGKIFAGVPGTPDHNSNMPKRTWEKAFHTWQQQVQRYVDVEKVKRSQTYQWLRQQSESGCEVGVAPKTPNIEHFKDKAQVHWWKELFAEWKSKLDRNLALATQSEAFTRLGSSSVIPTNPRIHHLLPDWPPRE